jgi:hypothetical protein
MARAMVRVDDPIVMTRRRGRVTWIKAAATAFDPGQVAPRRDR